MRETPPITTGHPWVKSDFTQFLPRWIRNKRYFVFDGDWWRIYESTKIVDLFLKNWNYTEKESVTELLQRKCTKNCLFCSFCLASKSVKLLCRASQRKTNGKIGFRVIEFSHGEAEILNELWAHIGIQKKFFKGPDANCRSLSEKNVLLLFIGAWHAHIVGSAFVVQA